MSEVETALGEVHLKALEHFARSDWANVLPTDVLALVTEVRRLRKETQEHGPTCTPENCDWAAEQATKGDSQLD